MDYVYALLLTRQAAYTYTFSWRIDKIKSMLSSYPNYLLQLHLRYLSLHMLSALSDWAGGLRH